MKRSSVAPWFLVVALGTVAAVHGLWASSPLSDAYHSEPENNEPKPENNEPYSTNYKYRRKRSDDGHFQPIRFKVFYRDTGQLNESEMTKLQAVVNGAINKAKDIFSVFPVQQALLMNRTTNEACSRRHSCIAGPCPDMCITLNPSYQHEYCHKRIDNFKIPSEHLGAIYLHPNRSDLTQRTKGIPEGVGVQDTDFILYVRAITNSKCSAKSDLLAYSSYCRLGEHDRPVSGYINFCPDGIKRQAFATELISKIAFHELLHTLGFSAELFPKFRQCRIDARVNQRPIQVCYPRYKPVQSFMGVRRLVTPHVVEETQKHFNCSNGAFGAILESNGGAIRSHWDPKFLQDSIMSPVLDLHHLIKVDRITLAAFSDMGWYEVKLDRADPYTWGRGQGCHFGLQSFCKNGDSPFFCEKTNEPGCHYQLQNKGVCGHAHDFGRCKMFISNKSPCFDPASAPEQKVLNKHGENYLPKSICVMSNVTKSDGAIDTDDAGAILPRCYEHRCNSTHLLEIRVGSSLWIECPFESEITVAGYIGVLLCPRPGVLCGRPDPKPTAPSTTSNLITSPTTKATTTITTTTKTDIKDKSKTLRIDLTYTKLVFVAFSKAELTQLGTATVNTVVVTTGVVVGRIDEPFTHKGSVIVSFTLRPAADSSEGPHSDVVYSILSEVVQSGNFTVNSGNLTYTVDFLVQTAILPQIVEKLISAGIVVAIALCSLLGIAILIAVLVGVNKYKQSHTRVSPSASTRSIETGIRMWGRSTSADTDRQHVTVTSHIGQPDEDPLHSIYMVDNT